MFKCRRICSVVLFGWLLPGEVQAKETILLSTIQRAPISTEQQTGLADRVAIEAFRRAGLELKIVEFPAKRALVNANNGVHDGDLARVAGVGKRYPNLYPVNEITWVAEIGGFSTNPYLQALNWDSLQRYHNAYIRGWVIFERNLKTAKSLVDVVNPEGLFKMLAKGRTDIALYERKMGFGMISKLNLKNIYPIDPPLIKAPIYIYLHKKHKHLIPKIEQAVRDMKQDGTYRQILFDALVKVFPREETLRIIQEQENPDIAAK